MDFMEFIKTKPQQKRPATEKQIEFAKKIAETLDIDEPDFNDFSETSNFISNNIEDYNIETSFNGGY